MGIRAGGAGIRGGGAGIRGGGVGIRAGGAGIRGGGAGIRGGGVGIRGGGAGIRRGVGVRGGGIQHQEYIMTFNEVLNTIGTHTVLSCFISFHQRTRFIKELDCVVVHLGDYQA